MGDEDDEAVDCATYWMRRAETAEARLAELERELLAEHRALHDAMTSNDLVRMRAKTAELVIDTSEKARQKILAAVTAYADNYDAGKVGLGAYQACSVVRSLTLVSWHHRAAALSSQEQEQ